MKERASHSEKNTVFIRITKSSLLVYQNGTEKASFIGE